MREKEDVKNLKITGEFEDYQKEERLFMLRQARERTRIRLREGRAQPVDLLVQFRDKTHECVQAVDSPLKLISRLDEQELGDLEEDVKVYQELDGASSCEYWKDILTVVQKLLSDHEGSGGRRGGINQSVAQDVNRIIRGKSSQQLTILRGQVQSKLTSGNCDVGFWESLLEGIKYHLAVARLAEMQDCVPENFKAVIERDTKPNIQREKDSAKLCSSSGVSESGMRTLYNQGARVSVNQHYIRRDLSICEEQYSPKYLTESEIDKSVTITDPEADMERLRLARQKVRELYCNDQPNLTKDIQKNQETKLKYTQELKIYEPEDSNTNEDGWITEEIDNFKDECVILNHTYEWKDKYRPCKPYFSNRVISGFVWNRYNRTHYDIDNPPPKRVFGYKFTIYYPDLLDRSVAPGYSITPDSEHPELDVLRFQAGPPYEDIAFKIARGEWNKAARRGYRCSFNGRTLQLWFHFKHMCYRR